MFKFAIVALLLFLYLILLIPLMLILLLISRYNEKLSSDIAQFFVKYMFRFLLFISGIKVDVKGLENIPKDEAVLFVSNHRSCFDILIAYAYTPKKLGFIAKMQMKKYILLREWMLLVNCLFLDRDDVKKAMKTILDGIEKIKKGVSMWICPEGTRSKSEDDTDLLPFKEGSFKIAQKSKKAIVPVVLKNTRNTFEKQFPKIKAAHVSIEYLEPIYMDKLDSENAKKIGIYTRELIQNKL